MNIAAHNAEALIDQLKQVDINVPLRSEGRKTTHTEKWAACRLLSTLVDHRSIHFPTVVTHQDKPDFMFEFGKAKYGIEVTEAIPPNYAKFCALAETEFPDKFIDIGHFKRDSKELNKDEMRELLSRENISSTGWAGDSPEQDWAEFMKDRVQDKLEKLAKFDYAKFDENWLSIYDNLPLPNLNLEKAVEYLLPKLQPLWQLEPIFEAIFVEHGSVIVEIRRSNISLMVIKDLWTDYA